MLIDVLIFLSMVIVKQISLENNVLFWFKVLSQGPQQAIRICWIRYWKILLYLISFSAQDYVCKNQTLRERNLGCLWYMLYKLGGLEGAETLLFVYLLCHHHHH